MLLFSLFLFIYSIFIEMSFYFFLFFDLNHMIFLSIVLFCFKGYYEYMILITLFCISYKVNEMFSYEIDIKLFFVAKIF